MTGKIFINYRRGDDPGNTGRLFDRLQDVFEPEQLFIDVDNIAPGLDFVRVLNDRVAECDVVLAVIGKSWVDARDTRGARRLDDPDDFVRIEILSALSQGKRVIPVLVGEAQMPRPDELPDFQGLVKGLQQTLEEFDQLRKREQDAAHHTQAEEKREQIEHVARERAKAHSGALASSDAAELRSFLDSYPNGSDSDQVRARLRRLESPPQRQHFRPVTVIFGVLGVAVVAGAVLLWMKSTWVPSAAAPTVAITTAPPAAANVPALVAAPAPSTLSEPKAAVVPRPDEAAWSLLKATTDDAALKRFIAQYPDSPLRKDAEQQITAIAAAQAEKAANASLIDPRELTRLLQFELKRVGCFDGPVNGEFDDATKGAWHNFTKLTSIGTPDDASAEAIKAVRGIDKRVCPLVCATGAHAEGDLCVVDAPPPTRPTTEAAPARVAPAKHAAAPKGHAKCFGFEGRQFCE